VVQLIKKLIVLNGTEGHKFEVGKVYANTSNPQTVKEILITGIGHMVIFENDEYVDILTDNVMVFNSK
jgi:hypothetical protein